MQFALNYSPQAIELLKEKLIHIDLLKCASDIPETIIEAQKYMPVYVHFDLRAGGPEVMGIDVANIERILQTTKTQYVNIHLGATLAEYPDIAVESLHPADVERITENMIRDVALAVSLFGSEKIILENWPYHGPFRREKQILHASVDPDVITRVINEAGCYFLFDIDHARAAAHGRHEAVETYVANLPMDKMRELHVTGSEMQPDQWMEAHLPMKDDDWKYLDWTLEHIKKQTWGMPEILAFEYGGVGPKFEWRSSKEVILEQIPLFDQRMK